MQKTKQGTLITLQTVKSVQLRKLRSNLLLARSFYWTTSCKVNGDIPESRLRNALGRISREGLELGFVNSRTSVQSGRDKNDEARKACGFEVKKKPRAHLLGTGGLLGLENSILSLGAA